MKKWNIRHSYQSTGKPDHDIQEIMKLLYANRSLETDDAIRTFIHPSLQLISLENLKIQPHQVKKAIERIHRAKKDGETIVIYTDYDVDGLSAGAVMWETLAYDLNMGKLVKPYVPDRMEEGYGLSIKGINAIKKKYGSALIITVDHGIAAHAAVEYAGQQNMDVIITDHHVQTNKPPSALAVIHSTDVAGCGVAWIFAREVARQSGVVWKEDHMLDLVALATIADLVPLTGINRAFVYHGLTALNHTKRPGLVALIHQSGLTGKPISPYEVGHILAPRINAMGRIKHAMDALRLLCVTNLDMAMQLAQVVGDTNTQRQQLTQEMVDHAKLLYESTHATNGHPDVIFLHHESYNPGIIGLIAGKMVEQYYRPAIVIAQGAEVSKASCRSIAGFNIVDAIRQCSDVLVDCGGHPMAAGFTVATKNIPQLKMMLDKVCSPYLTEEILTQSMDVDCEIDLAAIQGQLFNALQSLQPFGLGNAEPVFVSKLIEIHDMHLVGSAGKHIKMRLKNAPQLDVIGFGFGQQYPDLMKHKYIDIAYTIGENIWNGRRNLQLKLKDIKIPTERADSLL